MSSTHLQLKQQAAPPEGTKRFPCSTNMNVSEVMSGVTVCQIKDEKVCGRKSDPTVAAHSSASRRAGVSCAECEERSVAWSCCGAGRRSCRPEAQGKRQERVG